MYARRLQRLSRMSGYPIFGFLFMMMLKYGKKHIVWQNAVIITFVIVVMIPSTGASQQADVRILQSDRSRVVLEFVPHYRQPSKMIIDGRECVLYDFMGSASVGRQAVGAPDLLMKPILLRFPGAKGNSVDIVKAEYEDISNVILAPVPKDHEGELGPSRKLIFDPEKYSVSEFLPANLASLQNIGETRGAFIGDLLLHPYQYHPAQQMLRKYTRIVVRVNFGAAEPLLKPIRENNNVALNDAAFDEVNVEVSATKHAAQQNSVLSAGIWFRFNITEDGMYRFTGQSLLDAGIPSSTDPHTVKIYGNGGYELPMSLTAPAVDDLLPNGVYINDGGRLGQLDPADEVIFFGKSTRGWTYNSSTKIFSHYTNHYSELNVCWMTYGGGLSKEMTQTPSLNQAAPFRQTSVTGKLFRKDDKVNILSSGLEWLGQPFNPGGQMTYVHPLPGLDATQPIKYIFDLAGRSVSTSQFTVNEHNSSIANVSLPGTLFGDYPYQIGERVVSIVQVPSFSDGQSQLKFTFTNPAAGSTGYIRYYEIFYKRLLRAQNDLFEFHGLDTTTVTEYTVTNFSGGQVMVFDVTKFDSAVLVSNPRISADTCTFQISEDAGTPREIYVIGQNGFKSPGALNRVANQNLHGDNSEPSNIIITHSDFLSAAQRLQAHREQPGPNFLKTIVVDVEQIYNEFGGGLLTPVAIRNYLRYVYLHSTVPPKYVLLFGDADFDYKNIVASNLNWIPPWESQESFAPLSSYALESAFVTFFTSNRVDMGLGRLTSRTLGEANTMVDKVIEYETHPVNDPWKIRTTFVADDGPQAPGANDGFRHTDDEENVARLVPGLFEKKKIYLYEYPTVVSAGGRRKPAVNQAIQDQINLGTLLLSFAGHGNPRVWAHEAVFVRETDIPALHNMGKYFFLVAATCNYSHFDMLNDQSSGEILTSMPNAGAIAVFSANRPVYAAENAALSQILFRNLFQTDSVGRIRPQRLGDVIYRTLKQGTFNPENDKKYLLLGDPALQVAFPRFFGTVDSINHISTAQVTQLKALARTSVSITVRDTATGQPTNFSGKAQMVVFDANRSVILNEPVEFPPTYSYTAAGGVLFRGEQSVANGAIDATFVVPKDISYSNDYGRMAVYFWNASTDGAGYTSNFRVSGTDSTAPADSKGPDVHLYLDRRGFRPGDVVSGMPLLLADLFDSSGINTSSAGIGHRIEAWLDNSTQSIDLSDYYKSKTDTYREGTVEYSIGGLSQGTHKLRVRAWDTYDNSSSEETVFDVITSNGLQLTNIFNYPNPFSSATVFTFEHNQVLSVDAEIKIYTVAGRLIQSLKSLNVGAQHIHVPWDGRDKEGDLLANGVYLYKIIAKTQDGRFSSEAYGKLSVVR